MIEYVGKKMPLIKLATREKGKFMENYTNQQNMGGAAYGQQPPKKNNTGLIVLVVAIFLAMICFVGVIFVIGMRVLNQYKYSELTVTEISDAEIEGEDVPILEEETGFSITDEFTGNSFRASDGSVIYFEEEGSFVWYQDDSDHSDNYYSGTYDVYFGEEAEDYIVNDLAEYGVTEEELEDYYERNITKDLLIRQHLCCIVLHTEELIIGGGNQRDEPYDKNYMGFYQNGFFDGAYMEAAEYAYFTLIE